MTLDEIQDKLDDDVTLNKGEKDDLWQAIQGLDEPMRASMIGAFINRYPDESDGI